MSGKLYFLGIILVSIVTLSDAHGQSKPSGHGIRIFFGEVSNGGICSKSSTKVRINSGFDQSNYKILSIILSVKGRYYFISGSTISKEMSERIGSLESGEIIHFEVLVLTKNNEKLRVTARFTIE